MFSSSLNIRPALRTWAVSCALFAGTVLLFFRATDYGFTNYDDQRYVTNNPQVQAGFTWDSIVWAFTAPEANWHPLTWFSHMLDWALYGGSAGGHHLTSIGWHALNAVLVFVVLRKLTGAFWTSTFAAALFAWHPLRVESVVWIAERKDVLSGCFFLLTVWAYAVYAERRRAEKSAGKFYLLTLALFAGGLMSKPMVVSLPVVLLILDFWPLHRLNPSPTTKKNHFAIIWNSWSKLLLEKIPFFALALAGSVVTVLLQKSSGAFTLTLPFTARLLNAVVAVMRYLGKFFWPFDLTVCYPHPGYWPAWIVSVAALLGICLSVIAWRQRHPRPWLLAGWAWFLVMLLPAIGLVQVGFQAMADRYTYLPTIGLLLALLWTLPELLTRRIPRWLTAIVSSLLLIGCGLRTWNQQATWRDPVTLFEHAIAVTEHNEIAEGFLGYTYSGLGKNEAAAQHALRALQLNPRNETAWFTLAEVRERQLQFEEALTAYRTILELNPKNHQSEYNLALALLRLERTDEAIPHLKAAVSQRPHLFNANLQLALTAFMQGQPRRALAHYTVALALSPPEPDIHYGTGLALANLGRTDEALAHFQTTVQLRPGHPGAHTEIGLILLQRHQPEEAVGHFLTALVDQPKAATTLVGLARAQEQLGRTAEATASFAQAIACAPRHPAVFNAWAETLARRGQFAEAAVQYEHALQLRPNDASVHAGLGYVLMFSHRRDEAIAHWEEALRLNPNFPGLRERLLKSRQE